QYQPPGIAEPLGQTRDERRTIPRVWVEGSFEGVLADDELRLRKQELWRRAVGVGAQESTRMIEVQVTEEHDVDVVVGKARRAKRAEQDVFRFKDAVTLFEGGLEERANARL